jgi:Cu+-exporting ATPase
MKRQNLILIILAISFLFIGLGANKIYSHSDPKACSKACCAKSSSHSSHSEKASGTKSDSTLPPVEHKIKKEEIGKKEVCVMCNMAVTVSKKTPALDYKGKTYYFCDKNEKKEFSENAAEYVSKDDSTQAKSPQYGFEAVCSVCGMKLKVEKNTPSLVYKGKTYYFMNEAHKKMFEKDPEKYLK